MKFSTLPLSALLLSISSLANANDNNLGAFLGSDFALSQHKVSASGYEDESDMSESYSVYAGYQFHHNWGAKLSVVNFGSATPIDDYGVKAETEADGNTLTAVWSTGRNEKQWSMYAELGILQWDVTLTVDSPYMDSVSRSDSGTSIIGGLGGSYAMTRHLDITLFALWAATESDLPIDQHTTLDFQYSRYGAGLQYHF